MSYARGFTLNPRVLSLTIKGDVEMLVNVDKNSVCITPTKRERKKFAFCEAADVIAQEIHAFSYHQFESSYIEYIFGYEFQGETYVAEFSIDDWSECISSMFASTRIKAHKATCEDCTHSFPYFTDDDDTEHLACLWWCQEECPKPAEPFDCTTCNIKRDCTNETACRHFVM